MTSRLYHELADLWPIVCPPEDFRGEAGWVAEHARGKALLELGCGAGSLASHLADRFHLTLVDISSDMIERARGIVPGAERVVGDMRTVRLHRTFDTVFAVDALDYMTTERDLLGALETAAAHLAPGGRFLAAATYLAETFEPHEAGSAYHAAGEVEVVTLSHIDYHPGGSGIALDVTLIIRERGLLRMESDRQHCGLFPRATWLTLLDEAGFGVEAEEQTPAGAAFIATRR